MTALDIIVLFLLGGGAVFGFIRGFVQEALSLIAWIMIIVAVRLLHGPATSILTVLWLIALVPTLEWSDVRRELALDHEAACVDFA